MEGRDTLDRSSMSVEEDCARDRCWLDDICSTEDGWKGKSKSTTDQPLLRCVFLGDAKKKQTLTPGVGGLVQGIGTQLLI